MTLDCEERAWWVFEVPNGVRWFCPAETEADARRGLAATLCKERREEAFRWPLVSTRWCSRERLHR